MSPNFIGDLKGISLAQVKQADIAIVERILDCRYMQAEMTTRHLGIAAESNFSLQMWKWTKSVLSLIGAADTMRGMPLKKIVDKADYAEAHLQLYKRVTGSEHMFVRAKAS